MPFLTQNPKSFTNGVKVGDLITAYHAGYWKVTSIERRFLTESDIRYKIYENSKVGDEYRSLIHYELEYDSKFKPTGKKKKKNRCDSIYCNVVDRKFFQDMIQEKLAEIDRLVEFAVEAIKSQNKSQNKDESVYSVQFASLSKIQIYFAKHKVGRWLDIGGNTRTGPDADHSALLFRLLSGKEPLPKAPPKRMSYPWYELGEGEKIELDPEFHKVIEYDWTKKPFVQVADSGPFEWHDKKNGILVYPPSGEHFRYWKEGDKTYFQKVV